MTEAFQEFSMGNGLIEQLMARSEAQDAILQAIAGQVTLLFEDWRDALGYDACGRRGRSAGVGQWPTPGAG